jgi:hypothetical protein
MWHHNTTTYLASAYSLQALLTPRIQQPKAKGTIGRGGGGGGKGGGGQRGGGGRARSSRQMGEEADVGRTEEEEEEYVGMEVEKGGGGVSRSGALGGGGGNIEGAELDIDEPVACGAVTTSVSVGVLTCADVCSRMLTYAHVCCVIVDWGIVLESLKTSRPTLK